MKYKYLLLLLVLGLISCGVSTNQSISENDSQTSLSENSESLPFLESETASDSSEEESQSTSDSDNESSESTSDPDNESSESTSDVDSDSSESHISEEESKTEESTSEPPEEKEEVDIDSSKTQFRFDESLKYDDLYDELNKNNFTLFIEIGSRQTYENGDISYSPDVYETIAVTENLFYHKIDYETNDEYLHDTLEIAKIIDNKVHIVMFNLSNDTHEFYKIPLEAFYDTFASRNIVTPFAYLDKGEDGGFVNSSLELYRTVYGEYLILDSVFMLETYNFYYHSEFTNSEVTYYTYTNIGNTEINIDESIFTESNYDNYFLRQEFTYQGVDYFYSYDETIQADISIDYFDLISVTPGAHLIYPEVFNIPVTTIYFPYYVYNKNFSGYEYNVYFSSELIYQSEYSYIGEVNTRIGTSRYDAISFFTTNEGKFNYYGEW